MLKQIIAIIILSLAFILAMSYAHEGLQLLLSIHTWIADLLTDVFSGGDTGNMIRELIALLLPPILVVSIPALAYWILKRSWFPYFMECVWVIWLVETAALVILYKAI